MTTTAKPTWWLPSNDAKPESAARDLEQTAQNYDGSLAAQARLRAAALRYAAEVRG